MQVFGRGGCFAANCEVSDRGKAPMDLRAALLTSVRKELTVTEALKRVLKAVTLVPVAIGRSGDKQSDQ